MKTKIFACLFLMLPFVATAADRAGDARIGVNRLSAAAGMRGVNMTKNLKTNTATTPTPAAPTVATAAVTADVAPVVESSAEPAVATPEVVEMVAAPAASKGSSECRDAYRQCMDDFCLLDESEGYRCACSDNINKSKSLIQEIMALQEQADKLYTEGVEREQLGAKAKLVFGESEKAKNSKSGIDLTAWLTGSSDADGELGDDADIGSGLYSMASEYCAEMLESCGTRAEMEETLYSRMVVADCKSYDSYLKDQKTNAQANVRTAESAVRKARLEMLDTTNKYNRGECLLAYRSCIADKGGCGSNFENCLDVDLLNRRANACENVLDQCMATREDVLKDWTAESVYILGEAAKYADKYKRQTCLAQIQLCLEDGCSTSTNSACLTDVNVAAGICPIITECNELVPGLQSVINDKLGYMQFQFCENDVDKCLQEKCGKNYTAPECLGKSPRDIATNLCPQDLFPSCKDKDDTNYQIIVSSAMLQMDYQQLQGCLNYFGEQMGKVCGTDMSCLPNDDTVESLTTLPSDKDELATTLAGLRAKVKKNADDAVNNFMAEFEKDITVAACTSGAATKDSGTIKISNASLGENVFNSAKMIARIGAENRALRALESKVAEISRQMDIEEARNNCLNTYKVEDKPTDENKSSVYIQSVSFEPDLRNCHVCRIQHVCATGGESKWTGALKSAAGGLSAGASAGTMVSPGWGTAIGGVVGAVGMGVMGAMSSDEKDYCQDVSSCEDINM